MRFVSLWVFKSYPFYFALMILASSLAIHGRNLDHLNAFLTKTSNEGQTNAADDRRCALAPKDGKHITHGIMRSFRFPEHQRKSSRPLPLPARASASLVSPPQSPMGIVMAITLGSLITTYFAIVFSLRWAEVTPWPSFRRPNPPQPLQGWVSPRSLVCPCPKASLL
jgi:hypothetical protein